MAFVTVIVPVRNEASAIESTLRSLLTQDYPGDQFEVIVADGGSQDATVSIVRQLQAEYPHLQLLFNPRGWASAARNLGVRHMKGEFAVIVDGHCHVPDRQYLRHLAQAFEESQADCLGRPQPLDAPNPTPFQQAVSAARASRLGHNPDSDIFSDQAKFVAPQSTAVAYRQEVFEKIGPFDERFDACEDVELNHRVDQAGLTCYFTPKITVVYHPRSSFAGLVRQLGRYGSGRARLAAKHPHSLTLPALIPPLWFAWLLVGGIASLLFPYVGWLYLASILLYGSTILAGSLWLARKVTPGVGIRIPLVFLGIHAGFAWGFWRETLHQLTRRGRQR